MMKRLDFLVDVKNYSALDLKYSNFIDNYSMVLQTNTVYQLKSVIPKLTFSNKVQFLLIY